MLLVFAKTQSNMRTIAFALAITVAALHIFRLVKLLDDTIQPLPQNPHTTTECNQLPELIEKRNKSFDNLESTQISNGTAVAAIRTRIKRPRMEVASNTIYNSVLDIERRYNASMECSAFGGSAFLNILRDSELSLLTEKGGSSVLKSYRSNAMDIFLAENVSIVVHNIHDDLKRELVLEVDGTFRDSHTRSRTDISNKIGDSKLRSMTMTMRERDDGIPECTEYFDHPVMLLDDNIDTWNWWFFLISVLKHYITLAVVQPQVMGNYSKDLRIFSTLHDAAASRPFADIFDFMFDSKRGSTFQQLWKNPPIPSKTDLDEDGRTSPRYCFRTLVWSPGGTQGGNQILINRLHPNSHCFSSIVYSYASYLKAALYIPTLPRPDTPRVVWVARDTSTEANPTSWQSNRIIVNQDEVIAYLKKQCEDMGIELTVASFYGDKRDTAAQEQALFVSRADIMIGIHGAGLNMFHFMPFYSIVVELHIGTNAQKNSANFVNHIREAKYFGVDAKIKSVNGNRRKVLDESATWNALKLAIDEWMTLPETFQHQKRHL